MAVPERVKTKMKEEGLSGVNKPKRTPSHPKKSHCVMAKEGDTYKFKPSKLSARYWSHKVKW